MLRIMLWGRKKEKRKKSLTIFCYITLLLRVLQCHSLTGLLGCQCTISHHDYYSSETLWTLASGSKKATLHILWEKRPTFTHMDIGDTKRVTFVSSRCTDMVLRKAFCPGVTWSACLVIKPSREVKTDKRNGPVHAEITTGTVTANTAVPYQVQSKSNLSVPSRLSALFHLIKISIEVDLKNLTASETILTLQ